MSQFPSVSIVIPTWNARHLLEAMFPSLLASAYRYEEKTGSPWEIIVVDDGSADDTIYWVECIPEKRVKIVTRRRNGGFAEACNVGFQSSHHDVVILLNNDVVVDHGFIEPLVRHFEKEPVFAVTCKALGRDQSTFCNGGKLGEFRRGFWRAFRNYDFMPEADSQGQALISFSVCGGFCAFDRKKLLRLGGFELMMSPFYWEDVELSYRAWKRGWEVLYEPQSIVYHDASTTIGSVYRRGKISRVNTRNRFIFIWKNLHDPLMFSTHLVFIFLLIVQAVGTFRVSFLLGLLDALKRLPAILPLRYAEKRNAKVKDRQIRRLFQRFKQNGFVVLK
jgi:GT2 family glycosyltransferase